MQIFNPDVFYFVRHVSPLGAGSKSSVAQADEVIMAGHHCKIKANYHFFLGVFSRKI